MSNKTDFEDLQRGITTEQRGQVSTLLKSKAGKGYNVNLPLSEKEYGKWNRYLKSIGVKPKTAAPKATYSTQHLREMEEKKKHAGRGKYERNLAHYELDAKNLKTKERFTSGIAYGYKQQQRERGVIREQARTKHIRYSVRVMKDGRVVKPYAKTI